ncbi:hypothetical protein BOTBODRAFT_169849 [Botryobasidium botryosum FD-172 SS1]|uniref:Copper transport protein n=1 Tax=Botryobasidium botryosum (strain FD-172 SS1) TaxID=930990 RepID=A0A067MVP0_BOTB1|nr:hypothetical protein BOTBODRAFT_169849 [Botryobasidium botryosum FD-172 SS1]
MSMPGMNMGGTGANSSAMGHMATYLHFGINDSLWFKEWVPQSNGAFFGSCLGLFIFAIVERFVAGLRGVMELWWKRKAEELLRNSRSAPMVAEPCHTDADSELLEKSARDSASTTSISRAGVAEITSSPVPNIPFKRTLPPFIPSHDIPRGVLQAVHSLIGYALMLAVMMFNAGWFISIVIGLGVGEILFGRYSSLGH